MVRAKGHFINLLFQPQHDRQTNLDLYTPSSKVDSIALTEEIEDVSFAIIRLQAENSSNQLQKLTKPKQKPSFQIICDRLGEFMVRRERNSNFLTNEEEEEGRNFGRILKEHHVPPINYDNYTSHRWNKDPLNNYPTDSILQIPDAQTLCSQGVYACGIGSASMRLPT